MGSASWRRHSDMRCLSQLRITGLPVWLGSHRSYTPTGSRGSCCLVLWRETHFIRAPTRDWMEHTSLDRASCPFLLLHSAYWRASPGTGTEALPNIKAVSWCRFVRRPGAAGPVASWSKSKEIQQRVRSCVCGLSEILESKVAYFIWLSPRSFILDIAAGPMVPVLANVAAGVFHTFDDQVSPSGYLQG